MMSRTSRNRPMHRLFAAFSFLSVFSLGVANAELILNGSFELPASPLSSIGEGWVVGNVGSGGVLLQSTGNGVLPNGNGVQHLLFSPLPANIYQDIPLLGSATDHNVVFQMSAQSTFAPGTLTVDILRNGNTISSQSFSQQALSGGSNFEYRTQSFSFRTIDSGPYRIQFTSGVLTPVYLDVVSVTAVPEPSSILLMLFGGATTLAGIRNSVVRKSFLNAGRFICS